MTAGQKLRTAFDLVIVLFQVTLGAYIFWHLWTDVQGRFPAWVYMGAGFGSIAAAWVTAESAIRNLKE